MVGGTRIAIIQGVHEHFVCSSLGRGAVLLALSVVWTKRCGCGQIAAHVFAPFITTNHAMKLKFMYEHNRSAAFARRLYSRIWCSPHGTPGWTLYRHPVPPPDTQNTLCRPRCAPGGRCSTGTTRVARKRCALPCIARPGHVALHGSIARPRNAVWRLDGTT